MAKIVNFIQIIYIPPSPDMFPLGKMLINPYICDRFH